jgi:gliding motility-associated-like protein
MLLSNTRTYKGKIKRGFPYAFILILGLTVSQLLTAQVSISGVINSYAQVTNINSSHDSITLSSIPSTFHVHDTVMIYQAKGATLYTPLNTANPDLYGGLKEANSTGKYEVLIIASIIPEKKKMVFSAPLINNYDNDQPIQLVRVPCYKKAIISGELKAAPWDSTSGTGGILALMTLDTLIMAADINVSECGFIGGNPGNDIYLGKCIKLFPEFGQYFFSYAATDSSGLKGEGIVDRHNIYTRGFACAINGGGAGNGNFAGGGGGANYGQGGQGGNESSLCDATAIQPGGFGGYIVPSVFDHQGLNINRIFMGGGGGSGSQTSIGAATAGGKGGGIALIIAETIIGNNHSILSNGQDVKSIASQSGGGGGAGGTIILGATTFSGTLYVNAVGGDGGNTSNPSYHTGPGGGGGGGFVWYQSKSIHNFHPDVSPGVSGINVELNKSNGSTIGIKGSSDSLLILPLNGFLFNTISGSQKICYNTIPEQLRGSTPKGGNGDYVFLWQKQKKGTNTWIPADAPNNYINYQPKALQDTNYFRRIISSGNTHDTSFSVLVDVVPEIKNNSISANQIICSGQTPSPLNGVSSIGGNGNISYSWEYTNDLSHWSNISSSTSQNLSPSALYDTSWYRRKVLSDICHTYSDTVKITVLPELKDFDILKDKDVCMNNNTDTLKGIDLSGGDGTYTYLWQQSQDVKSAWTNASGTNNKSYFISPSLIDTIFYRRIVASGQNSCCKDTSNIVKITVLPSIQQNSIEGDDTICEGLTPHLFVGSQPSGGNGSYTYQWLRNAYDATWQSAKAPSMNQSYTSDTLHGNSYFKRVVYSGLNNACIDTSNTIYIHVLPALVNRLASSDTFICYGTTPKIIYGRNPSGGNNTNYSILWKQSADSVNWENITGINDQINLDPPFIDNTHFFRRYVASSVCLDSSAIMKYSVLPRITNNVVPPYHFVCIDTTDTLISSIPTGGLDGHYSYQWQYSNDSLSWSPATGMSQVKDYIIPSLTRITSFRRIVASGPYNCCLDTSKYLTVNLYLRPTTIEAGKDTTLNYKFDLILYAQQPPIGQGIWTIFSGEGKLDSPNNINSNLRDLGFGTTKLLWTVKSGTCPSIFDTLTIFVDDINRPNGFSPNGDGINDFFTIKGIENTLSSEFIVFNRWGTEVFKASPYTNDWNGKDVNGNDLPEDTYYYILTNNGNIRYKGFVVIKR